jgi:hypothetical protein
VTHDYEGAEVVSLHIVIDHMNTVKPVSIIPVHTSFLQVSFIYCGPSKFDNFQTTPLVIFLHLPPPPIVVPLERMDRGFAVYGKNIVCL